MNYNPPSLPRRRFLLTAAAGLLARTPTGWSRNDRPPNLIVFLTDDHRWDAMGCMNNRIIQTPNMDRLAAEGVLFRNHFCTTSICMSSRASIFTGLYTSCHAINRFDVPLDDALFEQIYPMRLKQAGYRTGFIGKWGLGGDLPKERFDYFTGFPGQGKYFHEIDGRPVHLSQRVGQQAEEFLNGCTGETPFCLSISFKEPHVQDEDPRQFLYDPMYESLYRDVTIPVPRTATEKHFQALPEFLRESEARRRWEIRFSTPEKYQESVKGYYRLITGADRVMGQVMDLLQRKGWQQNTVILFTSDNGFYLGEFGLAGKWFMHEVSIRTPLIVYDPRLPESRRGTESQEITLNIDLAPTILELAGLSPLPAIQGRSLVPLVEGKPVPWRNEFFYEHYFEHPGIAKSEGIRNARWKLVRYIDRDPLVEEVYDLENDSDEEKNLMASCPPPAAYEELKSRWEKWKSALADWRLDGPRWQDPV